MLNNLMENNSNKGSRLKKIEVYIFKCPLYVLLLISSKKNLKRSKT